MTSGWHAASCLRPKCAREQGFVVPIKPKGRKRNERGKLSVEACRTRHIAIFTVFLIRRQPPVMVHPSGALANKLTDTCQAPGDLRHARIAEPSPMASSDTLALQDSIPIYPGNTGIGGKNHQMAGILTCFNRTCSCHMCPEPAASFPGLPVPNPSSDRH